MPVARTGSPRPWRAPLISHLCQRAVRQRHRVAARHQSAATRGLLGPSQPSPARAPLGGRAPRLAPPPQLPCTSPLAKLFAPPGTEWTEQGRCPLPELVGRAGADAEGTSGRHGPLTPEPDGGHLEKDGVPASRASAPLRISGLERTGPVERVRGFQSRGPAHTCSPPSLASTAPPPGPGSTFTLGSRREGGCRWAWLEGKGR